ncbi:hypothetical protein Hanom_Chr15g01364921 [Helianthus anomalus]
MLNFRIKNGYFLGSRVPTTISATHLKMHALFSSTLPQVSFSYPVKNSAVEIILQLAIRIIHHRRDLLSGFRSVEIPRLLWRTYKWSIKDELIYDIGCH